VKKVKMEKGDSANNCFKQQRYNDNAEPTHSSKEQKNVEDSCELLFEEFAAKVKVDIGVPILHRDRHIPYLIKGLRNLSESYECLDASRPWLCYWILHSLELLDVPVPEDLKSQVAQFLNKCQCESGGFAGGPGQQAHLAPTYAAVNALCILGTKEAYQVIDRAKLYSYLMAMRNSVGAFKMHEGGEVDIRGAYCAVSAAKLTHIATEELFDKTPQWIVSCQTYEGGFAGSQGIEAHGGYSFCGIAALVLLNHQRLCDTQSLLRWTVNRQMSYEGGFQGRTNKLVDGCYSFWQGGAFPLLHLVLSAQDPDALSTEYWLFNQEALQKYILVCCQHHGGGLIDKPGKPRDYYHTCYCLSGLSVAQHFMSCNNLTSKTIIGDPDNELVETHPAYNIGLEAALKAGQYFNGLPHPLAPEHRPLVTEIDP
ncbi:unnamed protein product, partial [Owenia fusiformis]